MAEQYVPNLGETPTPNARRDAVHIAVAPVVAGEELWPADRVRLVDGLAVSGYDGGIGIVDPFLKSCVAKGERCWIFLYPNTVTSLRHVWSHPAFEASTKAIQERLAKEVRT